MDFALKGPIWPLLPEKPAQIGLSMLKNKQLRETEVTIGKERSKSEAEEMQLPIERLMPPLLQGANVNGKTTCALCEYVLHYIQDSVTNPQTEVIHFKILV